MSVRAATVPLAVCLLANFFASRSVHALPVPEDQAESRAAEEFFEINIRPLLIDNCYGCHSVEAGESSGQLRLDDRQASQRGGTRGPAVVAGSLEESLLIKAVRYQDPDIQMPPDGALTEDQVKLLEQWIASGAHDPRNSLVDPASDDPSVDPRNHWTFQPPAPSPPPTTVSASSLDILDAKVAERLNSQSMQLADRAGRETLLRRLAYDLTGLPPTPEIAARFLDDDRPGAYERLVDGLLAAPEFGERMARHWMDVARYADTVGYALGGQERRLRGSERYRDWLIRSFSTDLPFDQMVRYQLAADVHDPAGAEGHLDAMGFLTIGRRFLGNPDIIDDRIDVVSRGLLGLTVACSRCHDHKFDPIPTSDYYALYGVFQSSKHETAADSPWPLRMTDENIHDAHVFVRGQAGNNGPLVPRAFLSILEDGQPQPFTEGSGRKELAERIIDTDNPLTARVFANRMWAWLVGKPLVDSPSDFGVRTSPPPHPEVLDELATDLMRHQWSVKQLVRRIVLTHIYQQSSVASERARQTDPENRLLARANRERLDFESLRDSYLITSDRIDHRLGGEPIDILADPTPPRRTVYAFIDRQQLPGVFRVFDLASPDAHTPERYRTTVPQQSLFLLNSPFAIRTATDLVARIERETLRETVSTIDEAAFVDALFEHVLYRRPTETERAVALGYLSRPVTDQPLTSDPRGQWSYGAGTINEQGLVVEFRPFPHFVENRYQGGQTLPDPTWDYTFQSAGDGHPGDGREWATVRRWTADRKGTVAINARLTHPAVQGDGVRGTIASSEEVYWQAAIKSDSQDVAVVKLPVVAGQTIDFTVDCRETTSFDAFQLKATIRFTGPDTQQTFDSELDFVAPGELKQQQRLGRRQQLAQVLLMSNEFVFID